MARQEESRHRANLAVSIVTSLVLCVALWHYGVQRVDKPNVGQLSELLQTSGSESDSGASFVKSWLDLSARETVQRDMKELGVADTGSDILALPVATQTESLASVTSPKPASHGEREGAGSVKGTTAAAVGERAQGPIGEMPSTPSTLKEAEAARVEAEEHEKVRELEKVADERSGVGPKQEFARDRQEAKQAKVLKKLVSKADELASVGPKQEFARDRQEAKQAKVLKKLVSKADELASVGPKQEFARDRQEAKQAKVLKKLVSKADELASVGPKQEFARDRQESKQMAEAQTLATAAAVNADRELASGGKSVSKAVHEVEKLAEEAAVAQSEILSETDHIMRESDKKFRREEWAREEREKKADEASGSK